jgi:hypothetical protein
MPVRQITGRTRLAAGQSQLRQRLVEEWQSPREDVPQPLIYEQIDPAGGAVHLYVIWDEWVGLDQEDRSGIIMDAYEETHDPEQVLNVTVAMGLTEEERKRARIPEG